VEGRAAEGAGAVRTDPEEGLTITTRRVLPLLAALCLLSLIPASAGATAAKTDCGRGGVVCSRVVVPLDWSGAHPGKLALHVEVLRADGHSRGALFMLAGGPGQASAQAFALGAGQSFWRYFFPDYTLVAFDYRGTGLSGRLTCPSIDGVLSPTGQQVAACAGRIGSRRGFFRTSDDVSDIEAVRKALGFERIALWGVSYGTEPAIDYARAFPGHVDRVLLDSVVDPDAADPFHARVLKTLPAKLRAFCAGGACRTATSNYPGELVAIANALAKKPLSGRVLEPDGKRRLVKLDAERFLAIVVQSDLDPGLAAELPAAVHAARQHDPGPLLRLAHLVNLNDAGSDVSDAVYLTTICGDGRMPWQASSTVASRQAELDHALSALPANAFGGLGRWAAKVGDAYSCLRWPAQQDAPQTPTAYPDVPVLALSGADDIRTPTGTARKVVAHFPHGRLLEVGNVGHSVLTSSISPCVVGAVEAWLSGSRSLPSHCTDPRLVTVVPALPSADATHLRLATTTLHEAEAGWLLALSESSDGGSPSHPLRVAGLAAGSLTARGDSFTLTGYGLGGGITLTGRVHVSAQLDAPLGFDGDVTVRHDGRSIGTLQVDGHGIGGLLDGRKVAAARR
jgi:pimeloyl-ACP methyl ester carboxylesterase